MRRPLIAGNWKMYKTPAEALKYVAAFRDLGVTGSGKAEVLLCPSFPALGAVAQALEGSAIALGAQNMYWAPEGAFTGEVSAAMLRDLGCRYVIIGHSERRQFFGETDENVGRKAAAALENGLTPIVCVGETLAQREEGLTSAVVTGQVRSGLAGLEPAAVARSVLAYEPVWAIGTGRTASPEDAQEVIALIRRTVESLVGAAAGEVRILYGGSVKPANTAVLIGRPDIDGALVGGASLDPTVFAQIVASAEEVCH